MVLLKPASRFVIGVFVAVVAGLFLMRAITLWNNRSWTYAGSFVVIDQDEMKVTSYPYSDSSIIDIKLPPDLFIDVPGNYGFYRLKDIPALSNVEKKNDSLFITAVSSLLGLPINTSGKDVTLADSLLVESKKRGAGNKRTTIDLTKLPIYFEESRPDGTVIQKSDTAKIDYYLGDILWEKKIKDENLAIGVFNASTTIGVAKDITRRLEKIGIRVVEIGNRETPTSSSCVLAADPEAGNSVTYIRMKTMFNCQIGVNNEDKRFDITLMVGNPT